MTSEQIKKLEERKKKIEEQLARAKAREKEAERKKDTRRKILIGGVILKRVKAGLVSEEELNQYLQNELTNEKDLALFGLSKKDTE